MYMYNICVIMYVHVHVCVIMYVHVHVHDNTETPEKDKATQRNRYPKVVFSRKINYLGRPTESIGRSNRFCLFPAK